MSKQVPAFCCCSHISSTNEATFGPVGDAKALWHSDIAPIHMQIYVYNFATKPNYDEMSSSRFDEWRRENLLLSYADWMLDTKSTSSYSLSRKRWVDTKPIIRSERYATRWNCECVYIWVGFYIYIYICVCLCLCVLESNEKVGPSIGFSWSLAIFAWLASNRKRFST